MKKWQQYCTFALATSMVLFNGIGGGVAFCNTSPLDTIPPEVDSINRMTLDTIELVLKDQGGFDMLSLWEKSNYEIDGSGQVLNVLTIDIDDTGTLAKVVLQTTEFEQISDLNVYIENIKDSAGNMMVKTPYAISGDFDTSQLSSYSYEDVVFYGSGENQVTVVYKYANLLDISSLKNIHNYSSNDLLFTSIEAREDWTKNCVTIHLTTGDLVGEKQYHLTLKNIKSKEGTVYKDMLKSDYISAFDIEQFQKNKIDTPSSSAKEVEEKTSTSAKILIYDEETDTVKKVSTNKDIHPIKVRRVQGKTPTSLELVVYDLDGFDMDTLKEKNNYTLKSPLKVQAVESVTLNDAGDTATVILKTDRFKSNKFQKIKLSHIKDSLGNEIESKEYPFGPVTE